jgi:hypothetical protein
MSSEVQSDVAEGNSLAGRISKPAPTVASDMSAAAKPFQPKSGKLWSEETDSPISPLAETPAQPEVTEAPSTETPSAEPSKAADMTQDDGAVPVLKGSDLEEPAYSVQIKLADMQADPNNPLFSVSTFEELNL